jgi:predicted nucleic acid-binding protein
VSGEEGRAATVEALLVAARKGDLVVLTSTVSVVEVAFGAEEKAQRALEPATELAIDELWHPTSPVTLVEPSVLVMREARDLIRKNLADGGARLTPLDAVHLASAVRFQADRFFTYESANNRQVQWADLTGLTVEEPAVAQPPLDFGA